MSSAIRIDIFDCSPEHNLKTVPIMELLFPSSTITAEQLIRQRVALELERSDATKTEMKPLVQITEQERLLNSADNSTNATNESSLLDLHCKRAIKAFQNNKFFIIVDDVQIATLNEEFSIRENSQVEFFRLRALVGG